MPRTEGPEDSEVLKMTQKGLVGENTKQKTAPSFRWVGRRVIIGSDPSITTMGLPAAWGPFQSRPNGLPGAVLVKEISPTCPWSPV